MQDKPDILTEGRPVITIEQIAEPGQPAWWQAAFRHHHGFGPDPVAALDKRSEFGIKGDSPAVADDIFLTIRVRN